MRRLLTAALSAGLLLAAAPAWTAPGITLTTPADGSSVSRSTTTAVDLAGTVSFATPEPSSRLLYVRNTDANCNGRHLSPVNGADPGSGCTFIAGMASIVPGQENTFVESYPTNDTVPMPITIDGSRAISGSIAISSLTPNAIVFEVGIRFDGELVGSKLIDTGIYANSWFLQSPSPTYPFSIPIPGNFDKKDVNQIALTITWKRSINVLSTWTELDDPPSTVTIPTFTASFDRKVEVAVNNGTFTSGGMTLAPDLKSFTGSIATPPVGSHFVRVRAVQGAETSSTVSNVLHVTA